MTTQKCPKSNTPTLDRYNLHPFGGYCTCITHPYSECKTCSTIKAKRDRWNKLSHKDRKRAEAELDLAYPKKGDNDYGNGGR
jgi:hypothetical protein